MFSVDRDIPIPPRRRRYTDGRVGHGSTIGQRTYPFPDMWVGDSFFVPCAGEDFGDIEHRINSAAYYERVHHRIDGVFRVMIRRVENGARVWRTT